MFRSVAHDLADKREGRRLKQMAGFDQKFEPFFLDQTPDGQEPQGLGPRNRGLEHREVQTVIDSMDFVCGFGKALSKPISTEIADPDNKGGVAYEVAQIDSLIRFRAEYVVGMSGEAVGDAEKTFEPPSGPGSQTGKMDMNVRDPFFLESRAQIGGLAEATFIPEITGP